MSLVDYAASSDEDDPQSPIAHQGENEQVREKRRRFQGPAPGPSPNDDPVHAHNRASVNLRPSSNKQSEVVSDQSTELKLPDASFLLNSLVVPSNPLNVSDHSSRVAAAMAESAARKRESIGPPSTYPRSKVPKGTLPHPKGVPDTVDGRLLPPQLAGRSNVVTEDISKLFVRKPTNSSTE